MQAEISLQVAYNRNVLQNEEEANNVKNAFPRSIV